jgi:hypothetical protein
MSPNNSMQRTALRDLARRAMLRLARARFRRKAAQQFDVRLPLVLEVPEVLLRIAVLVQLQVHLRIVRFELRHLLCHKPIHPRAIAVTLGMRQMRQHLGDREAARRRLPPCVLIRNLRHQPAQYRRRRFEQVETLQLVVHMIPILRCSRRAQL